MVILSVAMLLTLLLIYLGSQGYFDRISWALVVLSLVFTFLQLLVLSSLSFLFSTFTTTSFFTLILTILFYFIGHGLSAVKKIISSADLIGIQVSEITVQIVTFASWVFPNLSLFDIRAQAAHGVWPGSAYLLGTFAYAFFYAGMSLVVAILVFNRRDFP